MRLIETAYRWQPRHSDPGYYLLAGTPQFEGSIGFRGFQFAPHVMARLAFHGYAAAIVALSAIILAAPLIVLARIGLGPAQLAILAVLGVISAIDAAVSLVNRGVTLVVRPVPLPGLELRNGVPNRCARSLPCRRS